jgi:hypothetical protein
MGQKPWQAESRSAIYEISRLLWNQKVLYGVQESPQLDPILSQLNPIHTVTP